MFNKEKLKKLVDVAGFTQWVYLASDGQEANAAAYQLGFFPEGYINPGDAVFVKNVQSGQTTFHVADRNVHEGKLCLRLFGG